MGGPQYPAPEVTYSWVSPCRDSPSTAGMIVDVLEPGAPGSRASASVLIAAALSAYTEILLRWAETDGAEPLEDVAEQVLATLRSL